MASRFAQRLIKQARNGDAQAQASLGKLYLAGGEGLPANESAALHWLALAADAGFEAADRFIADCIASDRVGAQIHQYIDACQRAANRGEPAGHCALGDIYATGTSAGERVRAMEAYRAAARAGYVVAARKLGLLLADNDESTEEAKHWLRSAAAAGDRAAAQELGALLWRAGNDDAARWLEPEAQNGDADAMYRFGEILCGQPDTDSIRRGIHWLQCAAGAGHAQALWRYGRMHVRSFNATPTELPHSPLQASRLLERAASAGVSEALWDLARIYEMPRFSRRDIGKARHYLEQAAHAGVTEAELELGKRLSRYKNDRNAWIEAGGWLSKAQEKGSYEARALIERIADRAADWPAEHVRRQETILESLRDSEPIVAARLELAARFGLTPRETLFLNPLHADRGWCMEVDLSRQFKRAPWRLVVISSANQRSALASAENAFVSPESRAHDLSATTTTDRMRQLTGICSQLALDPALFVRGWGSEPA